MAFSRANFCLMLSLVTLLVVYLIWIRPSPNGQLLVTINNDEHNDSVRKILPLDDITPALTGDAAFFQKNFGSTEKMMFFLVTTGKAKISARQVCAVESACVNNPSLTVVLVFVLPVRELALDENAPLAAVVQRWPNVRLATVNATAAMLAAGLQNLVEKLPQSPYEVPHLSDVLRVLLILNLGGVYGDLDLVMLRSLHSMVPQQNFMVGDTQDNFASCFFGLRRNDPLARLIVEELRKDYNEQAYVFSPFKISSAVERLCGKNSKELIRERKCEGKDVAIFNSTLIGPYEWNNFQKYLDDVTEEQFDKLIKNSVVFHLFNKLSADTKLPISSKSPYVRAARNFCPISLAYCSDTF